MEENNLAASFRAGLVSCEVFRNFVEVDGKSVPFLKAKLTRRYKDASGIWKNTESLALADIPLAIHVLRRAFELMANRPTSDKEAPDGADEQETK